jgi:glycosyltransferase involved in cell wall biosynthesis
VPGTQLLVVIPALNEEATVADVVGSAVDRLGCDVLVVDDGSTDATSPKALAAGAHVLHHPFNLGVGAAIRSGLRYAADHGYERVVQIDSDGQHLATEAAKLVAHLDTVDLVVGSRFQAGYSTGRLRRASMRLLARSVSRRVGVRLTDVTSGFRAFGPRAIAGFARSYPTPYLSDTVEALLLAGDWGLAIAEVPVVMRERQGGRRSAGSMRASFHLLRLTLVLVLHRVRRPIDPRGAPDVEA